MQEEKKLCKRCGRELKSKESIERGYGYKCHKKHLKEESDAEFERNQTKIDEFI